MGKIVRDDVLKIWEQDEAYDFLFSIRQLLLWAFEKVDL